MAEFSNHGTARFFIRRVPWSFSNHSILSVQNASWIPDTLEDLRLRDPESWGQDRMFGGVGNEPEQLLREEKTDAERLVRAK